MAQRQGGSSRSSGGKSRNGRVKPIELARAARSSLAAMTGRVPESVLGLEKADDGWKLTMEVVELSRVPSSTDVLGCYVVTLDDDGELIGYERVRRYLRAQSGGGDQ